MDTAIKVVDLAERLLGKFTVKLVSVAIIFTAINAVNKKINEL